MSKSVLDASAALAVIFDEPGADRVLEAEDDGVAMSAVNVSEVVARLADSGMALPRIQTLLDRLHPDIIPFDAEQAYATGLLRPLTRQAGLSLGDRACLALAQQLNLPALTADRAWAALQIGTQVEVVR